MSKSVKVSEISKSGPLRFIQFTLKPIEPSKDGSNLSKFLFTDGKASIWALSKRSAFHKTEWQINHSYELEAKMNVTLKHGSTTSSTSPYEIWLNEFISCKEIYPRNQYPLKNIQDKAQNQLIPTKDEDRIQISRKNEQPKRIIALDIYRYLGCVSCSNSTRIPNADFKKFICSQCGVEKDRRLCFMTRQLTLMDLETDEQITVVANHFETMKLFGSKNAGEFQRDEDVRSYAKTELLNQLIYLDVVKNPDELVAKNIRIVDENHNHNQELLVDNDLDNADTSRRQLLNATRPSSRMPKKEPFDITASFVKRELEKSYATIHPGLALIINNEYYPNRPQKERVGSKEDVSTIQELLKLLGIPVFWTLVNPSKGQLLRTLEAYRKALVETESKSSMVFLMGHGSSGGISLSSKETINIWIDIVYQFSDGEFSQFAGNPKMFFIQSCQGYSGSSHKFNYAIKQDAIADTLVVLSSVPGRPAYLYPTGSVFIQTLCKGVQKFWKNFHLVDIVKVVHKVMSEETIKINNERHRQVLHYIDIGLDKVYLNQ